VAGKEAIVGYQLGIDVGTTYTAAAVCRSADRRWVEPEVVTLGTRGSTIPSVLFIGPDGNVVVGEAAERRALTDPDRVVREFKRRIGDPTPIVVGGRSWAPEELSARLVRWVVDRVAEREGGPAAQIALTHPASWGSHKKDLLTAALATEGLRVTLLAEPQAAALHYATQERVAPGSTIAVYDLGGGTFDAAVVRKANRSEAAFGAAGFGMLGRPEGLDRLGGVDFDEVVFEHVRAGLPAAFSDLDDTDTGVLSAVARVRRECTEAKEALSADTDVSIPVLLPAGGGSVRLHRSEFESMIRAQVEETVDALRTAVRSAGCRPGELNAVLLVGGSSRIPLVAQLVSEGLARPVAVDTDPKNAIAKGAALSVSPVPTASWPEVAIPPVPAAERGSDGATAVLAVAAAAAGTAVGSRNGRPAAAGALGAVAAGAGMAVGAGVAVNGGGGAAGLAGVDGLEARGGAALGGATGLAARGGAAGPAGRHAAREPGAAEQPDRYASLAHEPAKSLLSGEPARPTVHPTSAPEPEPDPAPEPSRGKSVGLMVGVGLVAVAVIVLVALLVPRMTSSDSPGIVTESGASSSVADAPPPAAPAPAPNGTASGGSGGGQPVRPNPGPRQHTADAPAPAPAPAPVNPAVPQPSAPAVVVPTTAAPAPPSAVVPPSQAPAPQPAPSDTSGAIGSPPSGGDTATPVGSTGSTGSNTPVGTGSHENGSPTPSGGSSTPADPGGSATVNPPATAETVAALA
jgi:actin-like ATPase involved in cell morphogenesis